MNDADFRFLLFYLFIYFYPFFMDQDEVWTGRVCSFHGLI